LEELYINNVNNGIPEQIKNLKNLKRIGIGYGVKEFPKQLLLLENIEEIYLSYNDIHELPNEITQLKKLRILNIENTPLACFEFNYYCKYRKYKKLKYLTENMPKLDIQLFYSGPEI
jgi:Leucine-rich repeat (LRR) protein